MDNNDQELKNPNQEAGAEANVPSKQPAEENQKPKKKRRKSRFLTYFLTVINLMAFICILALVAYLVLTSGRVNSFLESKGISISSILGTNKNNYDMNAENVVENTVSTLSDTNIVYESDTQPLYKIVNSETGEIFLSTNQEEINACVAQDCWKMQGVVCAVPVASETPVYRLVNMTNAEHCYAMDVNTVNQLVAAGWQNEGICWYSDDDMTTGMHRLLNPAAATGVYYYTSDQAEVDQLVAAGWQDEGIAWYFPAAEAAPTVQELPLNVETETTTEQTNKITVIAEPDSDGTYGHFMVGVDGNSTLVQDVTLQTLGAYAVDLNVYDHYKNVIVIGTVNDMTTTVFLFAYDDSTVITLGSVDSSSGGVSLASFDGKGGFVTYKYGNIMLNDTFYLVNKCQNYVGDLSIYQDKNPQIGLFNFGAGIVLSAENQYPSINDEAFVPQITGQMAISTQLFDNPGGNQIAMISAGENVEITSIRTVDNTTYYFVKGDTSLGWVRDNDNLLVGMVKIS